MAADPDPGGHADNSIADFKSSELDRIVDGLGLEEKPPLRWDDYVDQCCSVSMEAEIQCIDKDRVFNDFFESSSISIVLDLKRDTLSPEGTS